MVSWEVRMYGRGRVRGLRFGGHQGVECYGSRVKTRHRAKATGKLRTQSRSKGQGKTIARRDHKISVNISSFPKPLWYGTTP